MAAEPERYGVAVQSNVDIPLADSTVVKADVLHPAGKDGKPVEGKFPVVLFQTPYNKISPIAGRSDYLVKHGYVEMISEVRGARCPR